MDHFVAHTLFTQSSTDCKLGKTRGDMKTYLYIEHPGPVSQTGLRLSQD